MDTSEEPVWIPSVIQRITMLHSVSKETHHEFIGFPCDPRSRSSDPGRVIFCTLLGKLNTLQSSSIYTLPQKKHNFPWCVSFETECIGRLGISVSALSIVYMIFGHHPLLIPENPENYAKTNPTYLHSHFCKQKLTAHPVPIHLVHHMQVWWSKLDIFDILSHCFAKAMWLIFLWLIIKKALPLREA